MQPRVDNSDLLTAGLSAMKSAGTSLTPVESGTRARIYRSGNGETVRVRTCNDHVLVTVAASTERDAKLNIEGTDHLLIVMPEVPRSPGPVMVFFIPTAVVVEAVRQAHARWLASNPSTKGSNRTWNLWFDEDEAAAGGGFARIWQKYKLASPISAVKSSAAESPAAQSSGPMTLGEVIADAKRRIATAAGVSESAIKISIEMN
jgi:hypothetical protein